MDVEQEGIGYPGSVWVDRQKSRYQVHRGWARLGTVGRV